MNEKGIRLGTSAAENEKLIGEELKYSWDKNRTKSVLVAIG
jgi:hypothetical protein